VLHTSRSREFRAVFTAILGFFHCLVGCQGFQGRRLVSLFINAAAPLVVVSIIIIQNQMDGLEKICLYVGNLALNMAGNLKLLLRLALFISMQVQFGLGKLPASRHQMKA